MHLLVHLPRVKTHSSHSETQLRSRLKKWRVTKPSRQTRKKPQDDPDSEKDVRTSTSPRNHSRNHRPIPASKGTARSRPDWVAAHPIYAPSTLASQAVDPQSKWNTALASQQLTPSPNGEHGLVDRSAPVSAFSNPSPTTTSFEPSAHTSPVDGGLMLNTTSAMTPSYAAYPLSPDSSFPSPGSATTPVAMAPWPSRAVSVDLGLTQSLHPSHWYSMPFEPITPPSGAPRSAPLSAPLAPPTAGYRDHMPMVAPQNPNVFASEFGHYGEAQGYHGYDPKSWKRAMSLQYDFARSHDHERKHHPHGQHAGMVPVPAAQGGPHAVMCAPIAPYMGQDPMVQRHPSVGY